MAKNNAHSFKNMMAVAKKSPQLQFHSNKNRPVSNSDTWNEALHPRHPAGNEQGGEFAKKGMTRTYEPKVIADKIVRELKKMGVIVDLNSSKTDFGSSEYIYFYDHFGERQKVRISDHSVSNIDRMFSEIHYSERLDTPQKMAQRIEALKHPERYNIKKVNIGGGEYFDKVESGENIKTYESRKYLRRSKSGRDVYEYTFKKKMPDRIVTVAQRKTDFLPRNIIIKP